WPAAAPATKAALRINRVIMGGNISRGRRKESGGRNQNAPNTTSRGRHSSDDSKRARAVVAAEADAIRKIGGILTPDSCLLTPFLRESSSWPESFATAFSTARPPS